MPDDENERKSKDLVAELDREEEDDDDDSRLYGDVEDVLEKPQTKPGAKPEEKPPAAADRPQDKSADKPQAKPDAKPQERPEAKGDAAVSTFKPMEAAARTREIEELRRANPALNDEEKRRCQYVQDSLTNMAAHFMDDLPRRERETDAAYRVRLADHVKANQEKLSLEREAGVFGPATQEFYRKYIDWMQKRAVPEAIREMDGLRLPMPPGCPIGLPQDRGQRSVTPDYYRALAANNELSLSMGLDPTRLPTDEQIRGLDKVVNWLGNCNDAAREARGLHQDRILNGLMGQLGLPEGWRRREGEDPAAWRASAAVMVDMATRTRNYVEAMQSLYKRDRYGDLPLELPTGTRVTVEHNGRRTEITAGDLADPAKRNLFKQGNIVDVRLDLPTDLRQDNPANQQRIERLREWLDRLGPRVDQAVSELVNLQANPDSVIMYGDIELRNAKGRFNAAGEFLGIANRDYQPKPDETLRPINLIGMDFNVENLGNGRYRLTQTVQAENAPWWGYQNFRCIPGFEKVGNQMPLPPRELSGDDFVPVRSGDRIEIVQVKNLERFKQGQQFAYWGEKVLTTTMDAAMLVSGTIEVGAAVHGLRAGTAAAQAGLRLTAGQAAWQITTGGIRMGVAGAGILNNAGGKDLKIGDWRVGEMVNTGRGLYFLGDVSLGLARGGWGLLRAGRAGESLSGAEMVHTIIHGRQAVGGAEALAGIPFVRQVHTGAQWGFKATEYAFAPVILHGLGHQIQQLQELGQRDPLRDATIQVGDGRGMQQARSGDFAANNARALEGSRAMLDSYAATLSDGRPQAVRDQVRQIFDQAKTLLGPDATPEQKREFLERMARLQTFTPDEIKELELAFPEASERDNFRISDQQLKDLMDPEKRRTLPRAVQQAAERMLATRDADVLAAARSASMFVARNADGNIPDVLASIREQVPAYEKTVYYYDGEGGVHERKVQVAARDANQSVTTAENVARLRRDLESPTLGNRGIVTGDVLSRVGAITHQQYAAILQDLLRNPSASRADKMRALTDPAGARLATITDGVRYSEDSQRAVTSATERALLAGQHFGVASRDLLATLERTAKTDSDPDVRAMAAAQIYALNDRDPNRRAQVLAALNNLWQQNQGAGDFARKAKEFLQGEMGTAIPEGNLADWTRERRLNSALALALITPATDAEGQRAINKAIADSFSATNPVLAARVVEALLPDRINALHTADAAAANRLRAAVVDLTRNVPTSRAQEEALVRILGKIKPLLEGGEVSIRQQLGNNLASLLNNNPHNSNYAEHYPALRAAGITALADMGDRAHIDDIRRHLTAEPKLRRGTPPTDVDAAEPDAAVRLAAVRALERMQDPELRSYISDLIDKEKDPVVATQLRDVQFFQQRVEPGSREYERMRTDIERQVINPGSAAGFEHMNGFGVTQAQEWLDANYPLLKDSSFRGIAQAAIKNATTGFCNLNPFRSKTDIENYEREEAEKKVNERNEQWNQLRQRAQQSGAEGDKARRALYYIASGAVDTLGASGQNIGLTTESWWLEQDGRGRNLAFNHPNFRREAAESLASACAVGVGGRSMTAHYVEQLLERGAGTPPAVRRALLTGLENLATPDGRGERGISREQLARTLTRALECELGRTREEQDEQYQTSLVNKLKELQYRMAIPVFDGLARSAFPSVRTAAGEALTALRDSVTLMYDQTQADTTATPAARAERLRAALADSNNAEQSVQAIFNAYKGHRITDANDPGLAQLQVAMQDTNERVRLAAAKILMESGLPNNNPTRLHAIRTLSELVLKGTAQGYRTDAFNELKKLNLGGRPLIITLPALPGSTADHVIKLEQSGQSVRATEYDGNNQVGWIYPGGSSMQVGLDSAGQVNRITENGTTWTRQREGDRYIDRWRSNGGTMWNGHYEFPVGATAQNGTFWYQRADLRDRWTMSPAGTWAKTDHAPQAQR